MKKCFKCKELKGPEMYSICRNTSDGLYSSCKPCVKIYSKQKIEEKNLGNKKFISRTNRFKMGLIQNITCTHCKVMKPSSYYSEHDTYRCRDCNKLRLRNGFFKNHEEAKSKRKEYSRKHYGLTKEARHAYTVKSKFGITKKQYSEMEEALGGVCEICQMPDGAGRKLSVDHNHVTGVIRGLLCTRCNAAIGALKTDTGVELLQNAIEYIKRTEAYI